MSERTGRKETPDERADRNWADLLQELRVTQTGVQLLAAFLVTLPFQSRFTDLTDFQRDWYLGVLALAFLTVGVTLAPVAIHRHVFHRGVKPRVVQVGHLLLGVALALIAVLLAAIAFLVVDVVVGTTAAVIASVCSLIVLVGLLVVLPQTVVQGTGRR